MNLSADVWLIIVTVALFGAGNGGLFLYKFGALNARVDSLEKAQEIDRAAVSDVKERVARVEGELRNQAA